MYININDKNLKFPFTLNILGHYILFGKVKSQGAETCLQYTYVGNKYTYIQNLQT